MENKIIEYLDQSWPLFLYFHSFHNPIENILSISKIKKCIDDDVLGIQTKMVGTDRSTEL